MRHFLESMAILLLAAQTCAQCGDCNGDGHVDFSDVLAAEAYAGLTDLSLAVLASCDVAEPGSEPDGRVTILDAAIINQFVRGLIPGLTCSEPSDCDLLITGTGGVVQAVAASPMATRPGLAMFFYSRDGLEWFAASPASGSGTYNPTITGSAGAVELAWDTRQDQLGAGALEVVIARVVFFEPSATVAGYEAIAAGLAPGVLALCDVALPLENTLEERVAPGDCDLDGEAFTLLDAKTAFEIAFGYLIPDARQLVSCDVDGDDYVTERDVLEHLHLNGRTSR